MKTIGLRDNICAKSIKTTCGSKILDGFVSPYNATIVDKLNKANIEIRKVDIKEFGIEEDNFIEVAFEEKEIEAVIATDLDGEIARNSTNEKVGIKPTFGLVSRYGVITTSPSLEQVGVIGKDIQTLEEVLNIIKGYDNKDSGSVKDIEIEQSKNSELNIGYIEENNIINKLKGKKTKIDVKNLKYAIPTHYIISSAETSSNLARFDGIRYGYRTKNAKTWKEVYTKTRQEGFGYSVKKKMITGTFFLDVDNMQNYYMKAQKIRTLIKREMGKIFEQIDVLLVPNKKEYTCLANLTGRPAITTGEATFIGKHFDEETLINLVKGGVK